jgi:aldehyde:ferredoxin oxidoreductase
VPRAIAESFKHGTIANGLGFLAQEMRTVVCRGLSMARLFNLREGMTTEADTLPPRLHEPPRTGPLSDQRIAPSDVREIVQDYYRQQGWHPDTGVPWTGTLEALGIAEYLAYASRAGATEQSLATLPPIVLGAADAGENRHQE